MNSKTTWLLTGCVVVIFAIIGIGFLTANPQPQPAPQPVQQIEATLPSEAELQNRLALEQPAITAALQEALPKVELLYITERAKLYHRGEWYGAVLQYTGSDSNNRDTLRIVLYKKEGVWTVRTHPPQLLLNKHDLSDAPIDMLNDLNTPAPLSGTANSPVIIPGE